MTYLRNCWYMAAWADDIGIGMPLARTLLDEPVVLWRNTANRVRAVFDRCPHRFAPLSIGIIDDDQISCLYHGLRFDAAGACTANPHGPITKAMCVKSYPVIEAHRAIWIWMGDPALADHAAIRDLAFLGDAPDSAFSKGYLRGQGHYQLFVDNILDLSHTDFLHPNTLGGGSITRTPVRIDERPDGIIALHWHPMNEAPLPLIADRLPPGVTRVDSWTEVEWSAPGVMKLIAGAVPAGTPRDEGGNSVNVHILTPETSTTTHYFFASTRDFKLDDEAYNEEVRHIREHIFSTEDEPMIALQQNRMGGADFWSLRPVLLKIDRGPVLVRRRMDALIASEAAAATN